MNKIICKECQIDITHKVKGKYIPQFCSKKCQGSYTKRQSTKKLTCLHCRITFTCKSWEVKGSKSRVSRKYCSPKCTSHANKLKNQRKLICLFCREDFIDKRGPSVGSKFCSNFCKHTSRYLSKRTVKTCTSCELPFLTTHYKISTAKNPNICNRKCLTQGPQHSSAKNSFAKPDAVSSSYVYIQIDSKKIAQHRHVMEQFLGRKLLPKESVHHLNGDRSDNRIENLELWTRSQPYGQRVSDKLKWAKEILAQYEGEVD